MTGEIIEIVYSEEGITVEMSGYKNGACLRDMEKIEKTLKKLGIEANITSQKLKPEGWIEENTGVKTLVRK